MAKDRMERDELAGKLLERAGVAEDRCARLAEMMADFVMGSGGQRKRRGRTA